MRGEISLHCANRSCTYIQNAREHLFCQVTGELARAGGTGGARNCLNRSHDGCKDGGKTTARGLLLEHERRPSTRSSREEPGGQGRADVAIGWVWSAGARAGDGYGIIGRGGAREKALVIAADGTGPGGAPRVKSREGRQAEAANAKLVWRGVHAQKRAERAESRCTRRGKRAAQRNGMRAGAVVDRDGVGSAREGDGIHGGGEHCGFEASAARPRLARTLGAYLTPAACT